MDSQIEEIKNKLNVLDIVGSYVKLSKTGVITAVYALFIMKKGRHFSFLPEGKCGNVLGAARAEIFLNL
jgi:hypothetical protein